MKVLFDFDDVIFNAKVFKGVLFQVLERHGYENVASMYEGFRKEDKPFSLRDFIRQIDSALTEDVCEQLYQQIIGFCEHCVNQEVLDVMKKLGKKNCYILTSGDTQFQKDKIERSIGYDVACEIVIVPGGKREEIINFCKRHVDENVVFVDDKQHFLNEVTQEECLNLKTVLFDEHGLEKLQIEIFNAKNDELNKHSHYHEEKSLGLH